MSSFYGWDKVRNDKRGWTDFDAPSTRGKIRATDEGEIILRGDLERLDENERKGLKHVFKAVLDVVDPPKEEAASTTATPVSPVTTVPATGNKKNQTGASGMPSEIPTDTK